MTTGAETLQTSLEAFVASPSDAALTAAQQAWLDARVLYGPTEAFRFYDGPIDNPEDGPEGQTNAWPLAEAYIDYVDGDAAAGIINDTAGVAEITTEVLVANIFRSMGALSQGELAGALGYSISLAI